jgi:poly(3-hydroxybutyrate) depolymerase
LDHTWFTPMIKHEGNVNDVRESERDMLAVAMEILTHVEENYPVDKRRITAVGISSGGGACWALAARYSNRFAAIVPLGSAGADERDIPQMLSTPIWAFHAANDPKTPIAGVRSTISALTGAGGKARLTETNDLQHDCWASAFEQHDLRYWLLSQICGAHSNLRPGQYRIMAYVMSSCEQLWPGLIVSGILALVGQVFYCHHRRCPRNPHAIRPGADLVSSKATNSSILI